MLETARRSYPLIVGSPGQVEADPDQVWRAFAGVVRTLARTARGAGRRVAGLACAISSEDVVFVDAAGQPVGPAVMALDTRSAEASTRWASAVGSERISAITGLPVHPAHPLVRLLWLRGSDARRYRKVRQVLCWQGFVAQRLGLPAVTDPSLAARTMAWDLHSGDWSTELLDSAGVTADAFPAVRPSGSAIETIPDRGARGLGLPRGAVFALGGLDQAVATLGAGFSRAGESMIGTGSWEAVTALTDQAGGSAAAAGSAELARSGISVGPFVVPGRSMAMATQAGGGSLVGWLRELVAPRRSVGSLLAVAPDRVSGLLLLPHLEGSYSPWMDPASRAAIAGIGIGTTRGELVRGVLESTTYELRLNLERLATGGIGVDHLRNTGGGSRSRAWVQLKADVLARPIGLVDVAENAAFGAACLAGQAVGLFPAASEAAGAFVRVTTTVEPRPAMTAAYEDAFARYRELYPALRTARRTGRTQPRGRAGAALSGHRPARTGRPAPRSRR